jgi:hypothetical protein
MEDAMHDSGHYRDSAADCLLAAQEASQSPIPQTSSLYGHLVALAGRKYEAIERLFQETDYKLGRKDHAA